MLKCITWFLCPVWRIHNKLDSIGFYELEYVPCNGAGFSIVTLGKAWGLGPGGRSWDPGSCRSSCQASLGGDMLEDSWICHSFERVKFSCVLSSEFTCIRFSQFTGTATLLMCSTLDKVLTNTTCYWEGNFPVMMFKIRSNGPALNGECPR